MTQNNRYDLTGMSQTQFEQIRALAASLMNARRTQHKSPEEMQQLSGLTLEEIAAIELLTEFPTIDNFKRYAQALGVTLAFVVPNDSQRFTSYEFEDISDLMADLRDRRASNSISLQQIQAQSELPLAQVQLMDSPYTSTADLLNLGIDIIVKYANVLGSTISFTGYHVN